MSLSVDAYAQTSGVLTLIPDATSGKDASILQETPSVNNRSDENFICSAWASNGPFHQRSLIEFDMSSLPANAVITSATLDLYCNTTSTHTQRHSWFLGSAYSSNESTIYRITNNSWTESGVTWSNAPSYTNVDSVALLASASSTQDYTNIDVTGIVNNSWIDVNNTAKVVRILLKLNDETKYRAIIFASSDHPDSIKRPALTIIYTLQSDTTDTTTFVNTYALSSFSANIFPNPNSGKFSIDIKKQ